MREFIIYAPAKLNLYLDVLEKRPDGYHNIKTLFEKIDLKDEIVVKEKNAGLDIKVEPFGSCPAGRDNIACKAVRRLLEEAGADIGLEILIKKNIPVSAGLGGGSSDAASLLRSINQIFELGVKVETLKHIASEIGKDVPFFMSDMVFAEGTGSGESLEPVDADFSFSHIIIKPDIAISTAEMYKRLDSRGRRSAGKNIAEVIHAVKKGDSALLNENYYNAFEEVLNEYAGPIEDAKSLLRNAGAGHGFLSGSGSSVFCTFKNREEAMRVFERLPKKNGRCIFLAASYKGGIYGDN